MKSENQITVETIRYYDEWIKVSPMPKKKVFEKYDKYSERLRIWYKKRNSYIEGRRTGERRVDTAGQ